MAARGSIAKTEIIKKILETFNDSFLIDKEIRIPIMEDGEEIQIKVTLTAAKVNIPNPNVKGVNSSSSNLSQSNNDLNFVESTPISIQKEPTQEEKDRLKEIISQLF